MHKYLAGGFKILNWIRLLNPPSIKNIILIRVSVSQDESVSTLLLKVPYGHKFIGLKISDSISLDVIVPLKTPAHEDPQKLVQIVMDSFAVGVLESGYGYAKSAAIAVNDKTRPVPHQYLLPPLLKSLEGLGFERKNIQILIASGAHPPMRESEYCDILPIEVIQNYPISSHNASDQSLMVYKGRTKIGTPIWINSKFINADLRIVIGNIEPHQFQGFSGGVKSAAIGLAGKETIHHNHAQMTSPNARLGEYENNPARQDLEEIGERIGVHYALNAILNQEKQIVHILGGTPLDVMRRGIPLARKICQVKARGLYDLLLVSPGGHPKDINLYQSQKGLGHARQITRDGGTIIMAAACTEGTGSLSYEHWIRTKHSNKQILADFQNEGFQIGPHKAYQIARDINNIHFYLKSDMDPNFVRSLLIEPIEDLQATWDQSLKMVSKDQYRIGFMPYAASTIPYL